MSKGFGKSHKSGASSNVGSEKNLFSGQTTGRCYETHKPLILLDKKVYGGSCGSPIIKDADIYVGLDMIHQRNKSMYPWNPGHSFLFHIPDMGVPADAEEFKRMIDWLAIQVLEGQKVHIGCIGGHGRTGTVLSALTSVMTGEKDAITFVRNNYCQKAVESETQIEFLHKHFGITKVAGSKEGWSHNDYHGTTTGRASGKVVQLTAQPSSMVGGTTKKYDVYPATHKSSVWGDNVTLDKLKY